MRRTEIRRKKWGVSAKPRKPLKKSGATKAKKVCRQRTFYASAAWKKLRKAALERAGHCCEYSFVDAASGHTFRCYTTPEHERLHVHHKTYLRFGGDELPEDLMVLCGEHHALIERQQFPHRTHGRAA